jgi:signal transduction histidine kinase
LFYNNDNEGGFSDMKLIHKIILSNIIILIGLIVSISYVNIPKVNKVVFDLEEKNAKEVLDKVYGMSRCVADRMESNKIKSLEYHKDILKNISKVVCDILKVYYKRYENKELSKAQAQKLAFEEINNFRYDKSGYVFIFDDTYHIVSHPNKKWIGTYMYNQTDSKGNYYARKMIDQTRKTGESLTKYWWSKIEGKEFEKLSYTRLFKPWKLYIGTGIYIDDIQEELNKQEARLRKRLTSIMNKSKIGQTGYIYVFKTNGEMIIHPDKKLFGGKFQTIINKNTGNLLYKDLIKVSQTSGMLKYKWNKITDPNHYKYDKISWVKYEPSLGWYIVSSAYEDEFKNTSNILLSDIMKYGLSSLFISLIMTILLTKKILTPLNLLLDALKDIKNGNYKTRIDINSKDEIGELSNNFNMMIETVEDNINNLDKKIQEKTEEIMLVNKNLELAVQEAINDTRKKEQLLQDQSRLAQMGEMISMIAHQWRQPLSAISSSVMGIQSKLSIGKFDFSKEQDRVKFLRFLEKKHQNIGEYVKTLSDTIDDFRNFFKPDKIKEKVSFNEPIKRALKIVETSMSSKGIDIKCTFDTVNEVYMYQNELMQVILNILKNAEDNFKEKNIENPQIDIITSSTPNGCKIEIADNGGGIPEDILPNIFDPYYSTKSEKNGTGLGLYMSKVIVAEHHGGIIKAINSAKGVVFIIECTLDKQNG